MSQILTTTNTSFNKPAAKKTFKHAKTTNYTTCDSFNLGQSVYTENDRKRCISPHLSALEVIDRTTTASDLFGMPVNDVSQSAVLARSVIMKTNDICLEEDYTGSVDKLLEDGFTIVASRKEQTQTLLARRQELEKMILKLTKEIQPELQRSGMLKEMLKHSQGVKAKCVNEIQSIESEIKKTRELIEKKKAENSRRDEKQEREVMALRRELIEMDNERLACRETEKREIEVLRQKVIETKREENTLSEDLKELKKKLELVKGHLAQKNRVLENKSSTYMGMLHQRYKN